LPLYSFTRFRKRAHFKFWIIQKAAVQFYSTVFNLLIFSWLNFRILILQFDRFLSLINQKSHDNQPISEFRSLFPEDSTWFLISDLLNSISQIHQNQIQVYQILISNLGSKIDSINGFQFKISRFLIPEFCLWTRFKFLISISKAA
jgi:hypothetical protein